MRNEELISLGARIKKLRTDKGLNQTELANMMGMDQPNLARIENGKVNVGYLTLVSISKVLEVDIKEFV